MRAACYVAVKYRQPHVTSQIPWGEAGSCALAGWWNRSKSTRQVHFENKFILRADREGALLLAIDQYQPSKVSHQGVFLDSGHHADCLPSHKNTACCGAALGWARDPGGSRPAEELMQQLAYATTREQRMA